jgi:hypothetical protein
MGGDEIVAEWLGDLSIGKVVTSTTVQRFCDSSARFKTIKFNNYTTDKYTYLGKYNADSGAFVAYAFLMGPFAIVTFEYADLYEFGCVQSTGSATLKWLGVNKF